MKLYDEGLPGRLGAHACDFTLLMFGAMLVVFHASWPSWICFVLASLTGLLWFNNKLFSRRHALPRPWRAPAILLVIGGITLWPSVWMLYDNANAGLRALLALAIFFATRFLYVPVSVPKRTPLRPSAVRQLG